MSRTVHVEVTQEDIEVGGVAKGDGARCPVARAVSRVVAEKIHVSRYNIRTLDAGRRLAKLPSDVSDWIEHFDANESVEPFSFDFELED